MVGETLGKYRIVRELGKGGMGVVYAAEHERLGKQVAVKVINPELSKNQEVLRRFFAEAVAATRVKHTGITEVFDYGEEERTGCASPLARDRPPPGHINAEELAAALGIDAGRDYHRDVDDAAALAALEHDGIEPDVPVVR